MEKRIRRKSTNWHYNLDKAREWGEKNGLEVRVSDPPCGLDISDGKNGRFWLSICNDDPTIVVSCIMTDARKIFKLSKSLHRYAKERRGK